MSKMVEEIITKLFTDWKGREVSRLIQEGTGDAGWGAAVVRDIIEQAEKKHHPKKAALKRKKSGDA